MTSPIDAVLDDCALAEEQLGALLGALRDELARKHGQARRRLAGGTAVDLLAWGRKYLPQHFTRPASDMHRWLARQLDQMCRCRGTKVNLLGPRGSAKSTLGTLAFPLWAAVECREPYIWIVSDTRHQACAHLANLRAELADNPRLAADYPQAAGRGLVWRENVIVLRNGVRVEAFGTGQRIRGQRHGAHRPTLIICDDLQNDDHIHSAHLRGLAQQWFDGTLLRAGTARTNVLNLATALHREALAVQLNRRPGWISRIFKAIQRWPDQMDLWERWEAIYTQADNPQATRLAWRFYEEHRRRMDAGAIVLWPEEEDLYTLMCIRAESGRVAFEREKQNSPIAPELCEWPEEYFSEQSWFDAWPAGLVVKTMALDPSKGADSRRGDYSALVMLGVDRQGAIYVEADLARRPVPQIIADAVAWYQQFQPDVFGVEANQFQELLAGQLEVEFRRRGLLAARPVALDNRVNKLVRIRRLGPYLASGRLRFKRRSPGTRLLVEQLRNFPAGDHDDGPDAAEMALRLAAEWLRSRHTSDGLGHRLPVSY